MTPAEARELFERGRRAIRGLAVLRAHRERLESGGPRGGIPAAGGAGPSDPVGRAGTALADAGLSEEERALEAEADEARRLCAGLGKAFRREQGVRAAMESHYILDMEWKEVAAALGCSVSHAMALQRVACEYVAQVGPAAAMEGRGRAEM